MQPLLSFFAVVLCGTAALAADGAPAGDGKPAPAEQLKALSTDFSKTSYAHNNAPGATDQDRAEAVVKLAKITLDTLEFARSHPREPVALEALNQVISEEYWLTNYSKHPGWGHDSPQAAAFAQLLRDHLESDQLAESCKRANYGFREECATFLRTVLEKSPHREVRGAACLRLAQFLAGRHQKLGLLKNQPEAAQRWELLFGNEYLQSLRRQDHDAVMHEVESLYEQAIDRYGDVPMPYGGPVGTQAKTELFEIRHLAPGKEAPDIEGVDQDEQKLKLSDYRGKVVLIYFWSEY